MSRNVKMANAAVNEQADRLATLANGGYLRIYDGAQPATADAALSGQNLLAELVFGNPAFGSSVAGVITANPITAESDAKLTGAASWFCVWKSDGSTPLWTGSAGVSGCDLNLNSTAIQQHANVSVSSLVHTVSK
jgi:hypothetical protein